MRCRFTTVVVPEFIKRGREILVLGGERPSTTTSKVGLMEEFQWLRQDQKWGERERKIPGGAKEGWHCRRELVVKLGRLESGGFEKGSGSPGAKNEK